MNVKPTPTTGPTSKQISIALVRLNSPKSPFAEKELRQISIPVRAPNSKTIFNGLAAVIWLIVSRGLNHIVNQGFKISVSSGFFIIFCANFSKLDNFHNCLIYPINGMNQQRYEKRMFFTACACLGKVCENKLKIHNF